MRLSRTAGIAVAAVITVTSSALAQTSTPPPSTPQSAETAAVQTFTGCLMKESDYRRAHNLGDGAVNGVGLGDEFVLTDVKVSAASVTTATSSATVAGASNVTASTTASTCADKGVAYRLTGSDEEQLKTFVGRQLAVVGRFKHAADVAAGGTRPDEKLPAEVEMISFGEAPSPSTVSEPVAATPPPPPPPPPTMATPPPPPASTVTTPRQTTPPVATPPPAEPVATRSELPRTAGATGLLALIGALALISGVAVSVMRRRAL